MGMIGLVLLVVFVLLALAAPLLVSPEDLKVGSSPGVPFEPPSAEFPLGTDDFGRSVLDLVLYGSRISLLVGFAATVVTMVVGTAVGISGGYYGGRVDTAMNAFTNWFLVIPWIPLAIVLASILGRSLFNTILVIGITSWAGTARLVRADTLSVKERPYVETGPGTRLEQLAPRQPPYPAKRDARDLREYGAHGGAVDPGGNDPGASRSRRPVGHLLGRHHLRVLRRRRPLRRAVVVAHPAGGVHLPRHARLHDVRLRPRRGPESEDPGAVSG